MNLPVCFRLVLFVTSIALLPVPVLAQQIRGRVVESETGDPMPGSVVSLLDERMNVYAQVRTDTYGAFTFDRVARGTYTVQAEMHGRFSPISASIVPGSPQSQSIVLVVPSILFELSGTCPISSNTTTVLAGIAYEPSTGVVLPGATVEVMWPGRDTSISATTDAAGRYRFCSIPVATPIRLRLAALGRSSQRSFDVPDASFVRADLGLDLDIGSSSLRIIDTIPLEASEGPAEVRGRIVSAGTEQPIADVVVRETRSRSFVTSSDDGTFRLLGLPPGDIVIELEHLVFGTHRELVSVENGTALDVELILAPKALTLDPLRATARGGMHDARRMATTRFGGFAGATLAAAEARGESVVDVVRRIPSLLIMEGMFTTRYGVTNGVCLSTSRRQGTLRGGAGTPFAPWCESMPVIVDGIAVGDPVAFLRSVRVTDYESIVLLSPMDAQILFGMTAGAAGGALVLWTRGRGPYVSPERNTRPR